MTPRLGGATDKEGNPQHSTNRTPLHSTGQSPKDLLLATLCVIGDWRAPT
jgi:hypothetical protein